MASWWDLDPQPLNGFNKQSRSPMRYPLRHRDHQRTRVGHVKVFLPCLCPSSSVRFARSVHRKDWSSGLCAIDARFKNGMTEFVECVRLTLLVHACVIIVVPLTLIKRKFVPRTLIWALSNLQFVQLLTSIVQY